MYGRPWKRLSRAAKRLARLEDRDVSVTIYSEDPSKGSSTIYYESASAKKRRAAERDETAKRAAAVRESLR